MAKLLIFDFDGTLMHTSPGIYTAVNKTLTDFGFDTISQETVETCIGMGLLYLIQHLGLHKELAPDRLKEMAQVFRSHYEKVFREESHPYPGVVEFLKEWPGQIAIASNKEEYFVHESLKLPIWEGLNWVLQLGGNSLPTKKPHPAMIEKIIGHSDYSLKDAVIIGDGEPDVEVAMNSGIKSIAVSYGYGDIDKLMSLGAHGRIDNFGELSKAIEQL